MGTYNIIFVIIKMNMNLSPSGKLSQSSSVDTLVSNATDLWDKCNLWKHRYSTALSYILHFIGIESEACMALLLLVIHLVKTWEGAIDGYIRAWPEESCWFQLLIDGREPDLTREVRWDREMKKCMKLIETRRRKECHLDSILSELQ